MIRLRLCTCWVDLSTRFSLFVMNCIKIINDTKFMLVSFDVNLMYTLINVRCTRAEKYSNLVMLQIFDNLFHYKNNITVQWIKRLKLCMVTMATLPPAKELKIQNRTEQNRTDCLFDINHTVSSQSYIHITQYICHVS